MRPAKCKAKAEVRYHKAEVEAKKLRGRIQTLKNCEAEDELCEAKARDAVLTINY